MAEHDDLETLPGYPVRWQYKYDGVSANGLPHTHYVFVDTATWFEARAEICRRLGRALTNEEQENIVRVGP